MSNHDELRILLELAKYVHESADVRVIQRGIDFVQNTERTGAALEDRQQQRHGCQRLLSTAQQRNTAKFLAGRASHHVNRTFQYIFRVFQNQVGFATAEQLAKQLPEIAANDLEGLDEHPLALNINTSHDVSQGVASGFQVRQLHVQPLKPSFQLDQIVETFAAGVADLL